MQQDRETDVLIIGAGPAGLAAATYTARANRKTIVLKGKTKSRLAQAHLIENYPGFVSIGGQELLDRFEEQARHFGAEIIETDAIDLGLGFDPKMVNTRNGMIMARAVILATGKGKPATVIENEENYIGLGLSYCVVCDGALYKGRSVVVYGNDDEVLDEALMLKHLGCQVTVVSSQGAAAFSPELMNKAGEQQITFIGDTKIKRILGEGVVTGLELAKPAGTEQLPTNAVFMVSHGPGPTLLKRAGLDLDSTNCIVVNRNLETNIPGVYAAGDIVCGGMQIATAVGDGVSAALSTIKYLRSK